MCIHHTGCSQNVGLSQTLGVYGQRGALGKAEDPAGLLCTMWGRKWPTEMVMWMIKGGLINPCGTKGLKELPALPTPPSPMTPTRVLVAV